MSEVVDPANREAAIRAAWTSCRERAINDLRKRGGFCMAPALIIGELPPVGDVVESETFETFTFTRRVSGDGAMIVECDGIEVERVPPPMTRPYVGPPDLYALAMTLNRLPVGDAMRVTGDTLSQLSYSSFGYRDLWHALRGNLIGSSYGSFRRRVEQNGWIITRREEGERLYDRDGYPLWYNIGDPATDATWYPSPLPPASDSVDS